MRRDCKCNEFVALRAAKVDTSKTGQEGFLSFIHSSDMNERKNDDLARTPTIFVDASKTEPEG